MDEVERAYDFSTPEDYKVEAEAEEKKTTASSVLSALVRQLYVTHYRARTGEYGYGVNKMVRWDGGTDSVGTTHSPIWPKIGAKIMSMNADPLLFVEAQFAVRGKSTRPPYPNMFLGDAAVTRYIEHKGSSHGLLTARYKRDLAAIKSRLLELTSGLGWEFERALRQALLDEVSVYATPLTRYLMAESSGLEDIMERYYEAAVTQYIFQPDVYDEHWPISEVIKKDGIKLRSQLLGGLT